MTRRRLDGLLSAVLAALLVAQVMTVAVRHASTRHVVSERIAVQHTVTVRTTTTPKPSARQRHLARSPALPAQPAGRVAARPVAAPSFGGGSSHHPLTPRLRRLVPRQTLLVHLVRRTPGFATSTSHRRAMTIPARWYGHWSVLPVVATGNFRLKVRLSRRPNGATTWVRASDVRYSRTPYAVLVDLSYRRLFWFRSGRLMGSYPVGVGAPADPTPTGSYFVAFHSPPPDPGYGSVVLATSAHSEAIRNFGGNDAIIAIHGPIDAAGSIGSGGAAISHGCIRMLDPDLAHVGDLPDGTPVVITY